MEKETGRVPPLPSLILYLLGLLLMLAVAAITIWPEMEVTMFDPPLITEEALGTLRCPPAITPDEQGAIQATLTNEQEREQAFRAQARISFQSAQVVDEVNQWVTLAPGETRIVRWPLDPAQAAFGRMILARVHISRRGSIPPQQRGCGVMVLNWPHFTGTQYVLGMAGGGLLALVASGLLWLGGRHPARLWEARRPRRLVLLALAVAGAMVAGLFNLWAPAGLLLLFAALLLVSFGEA